MKFEILVKNFSLRDTLFCGQCFRFKAVEDGWFILFAGNNSCYVKQVEDSLIFERSTVGKNFWNNYFNFTTNYDEIFSFFDGDLILEKLAKAYRGIRILKQDPFETLISFIISINNNIPRIKNIIELLCKQFGEKNKNGYSFPTAERLKRYDLIDFNLLKIGFRSKYIVDAVDRVYSKEVDLKNLYNLSVEKAKEELMKIYGVGEKVATCVILFGYNNMNACPVDIWIKRALEKYYSNGATKQFLRCPGVAQQLLYYGMKNKYI